MDALDPAWKTPLWSPLGRLLPGCQSPQRPFQDFRWSFHCHMAMLCATAPIKNGPKVYQSPGKNPWQICKVSFSSLKSCCFWAQPQWLPMSTWCAAKKSSGDFVIHIFHLGVLIHYSYIQYWITRNWLLYIYSSVVIQYLLASPPGEQLSWAQRMCEGPQQSPQLYSPVVKGNHATKSWRGTSWKTMANTAFDIIWYHLMSLQWSPMLEFQTIDYR